MTDLHHTIHIDRDPEPTASRPTDQMLRAQSVLESLDELRSSGASIEEQVRYLRQNLPAAEEQEQAQEPSSIAERLARQERLKADFNELRSAMVNVMAVWNQPEVLPEDVRIAGFRLLKHLDVMREEAEKSLKQGWKSEVGMLSEVWESAPDLSAVFDTTPTRTPRHLQDMARFKEAAKKVPQPYKPNHEEGMARVKKAVKEPSFKEQVREAVKKADARAKERAEARRVPHKVLHEPVGTEPDWNAIQEEMDHAERLERAREPFLNRGRLSPASFGKRFSQEGDRMAEQIHARTDWKKMAAENDARLSRDDKLVKDLEDTKNIVGDPKKIKLKLPELGAEATLEPPTSLTIETWTEALNALVISKTDTWDGWSFDMELNGSKGEEGWPIQSLTWKGNGGHVRLHRQVTPACVNVRLEIYLDGVIYTSGDMVLSDPARLRTDPAHYIKQALDNPTE